MLREDKLEREGKYAEEERALCIEQEGHVVGGDQPEWLVHAHDSRAIEENVLEGERWAVPLGVAGRAQADGFPFEQEWGIIFCEKLRKG